MSFDLKILVIGQKKPSKFESQIEIVNETDEILRYQHTWRFMSSIKGMMYSLGKTVDDLFDAMPLIDTNFEYPSEYPYWIYDEDVTSNLTPLSINIEYEHELKYLLKQMIEESPVKMIVFMTRYQGGDTEVLCGVIKLDKFWEYIKEDKLLFNTCYIIQI